MADQIFEDLIEAVERQGVNQVEVTRAEANDFRMRSLTRSRVANCTVTIFEHEPTFHVNFNLAAPSMRGLTFHVSESDAHRVAPSASKVFPNVDEAARWLLKILDIPYT
jgi:hypothetical protein